jgi:phage terminase large subunit
VQRVYNEHHQIVEISELEWGDIYAPLDQSETLHKHFPCHYAQRQILETTARFILALGGKNSGKSVVGGAWLLARLQEKPDGQYLVVAPSFPIVTGSTREVWEKTVRGTAFQGSFHAGNSPYYECGTGARIYFRSAVDPDSFEGLKPLHAWIDEGGNISAEAWKAVKGRLVGTGGRVVITTTPYPKFDWLTREIIPKADEGHKDYFYLCFPTTANPKQDLSALAEEKATLSEWEYQVKYEGKFTKPKGLVYPDFDKCDFKLTDLPSWDHATAVYGSIDWGGGADPTSILLAMLDDQHTLWLWYEKYIKDRREDIIQTLEGVKEFETNFRESCGRGVDRYWCDHRPENIRALKRLGLNARSANKGANSIEVGISLMTARIRRTIEGKPRGLRVCKETCPEIFREASLYKYPVEDGGEVFGNVPLDKHNHSLDACRYIILGLDRKQARVTT